LSPEQLLGSVDFDGLTVIADMEAGIGTLTRLGEERVDAVLVVVEPTPKSIEVGQRAAELATGKQLGRLIVVASRVRTEADMATLSLAFEGHELVAIPDDPAIVEADRMGVAPLDLAPDSPAVQALCDLARSLLPVPA
jgi:CO dehydrogenase maturation factor